MIVWFCAVKYGYVESDDTSWWEDKWNDLWVVALMAAGMNFLAILCIGMCLCLAKKYCSKKRHGLEKPLMEEYAGSGELRRGTDTELQKGSFDYL